MGRPAIRNFTTDYFFGPLTEDRLWVLGWFYSDGNVDRNYDCSSITVHSKDEEVLIKIARLMKHPKPSTPKSRQNACILRINSRVLGKRLTELGCIPAKSLILTYPSFLSTRDEHKAFLRGVFEGDGSAYGMDRTGRGLSLRTEIASGSVAFMETLRVVIKTQTGLDSVIKNTGGKPRRLIIGHGYRDALVFLDYLYEGVDPTLTLARKRQIWLDFKARVANPPASRTWNINTTRHRAFYVRAPNGIVYHSDMLKPFADEMGLSFGNLGRVVTRKYGFRSIKGWRLPTDIELNAARDSIVLKCYAHVGV